MQYDSSLGTVPARASLPATHAQNCSKHTTHSTLRYRAPTHLNTILGIAITGDYSDDVIAQAGHKRFLSRKAIVALNVNRISRLYFQRN